MRIGLISDGIYPYVIGGMQKHSYYLAKYFAKNNICVDLYHFTEHNKEKSKEEVFGDESEKIEFLTLEFPRKGNLPLHYLRESKEYSRLVYDRFKERPFPDVLICKGFTGWEFIRRKRAGEKLPPICVNFHGYEMFQRSFSLREKIIQRILRKPVAFISRNADYVFSYGGKITEIIREKVKVHPDKILEFTAGIEPEWLNENITEPKKIIHFVFAGRNEPRKGLKELNTALSDLLLDKKLHFSFIGNIPEEMKLKSDKVTYYGLITDQQKIKKIFSGCDVMVSPSWSEGMPNVILEGMASGLAILATDTGATGLLVNEKNGWMIDNPSEELLNRTFTQILNTSFEVIFYKKNEARKHVQENFLWPKISIDLINKLNEIANER